MYVVIRKFNRMRSVAEAARRAESGIGQLLKQSPGFQGYHVFDASDGLGGSVTTSNPDHRHPGWSGSSHLHRAFVWAMQHVVFDHLANPSPSARLTST